MQLVANQRTDLAAEMSWVGYYRVSTGRQLRSGLGLTAQQISVRGFVRTRGGTLVSELVEVESGRRCDRPQLAEALRLCRVHSSTLVIAKLDRLARNVAFVSSLMKSKIDFVAVDFPTANRLTIHILAAVAEHEGQLIRDRTRAALAAAKERGQKLGGNRGNLPSVSERGRAASAAVRSERAKRRAQDLLPLLLRLKGEGLSLRQMADELRLRGIAPARTRWGAPQIRRMLNSGVEDA